METGFWKSRLLTVAALVLVFSSAAAASYHGSPVYYDTEGYGTEYNRYTGGTAVFKSEIAHAQPLDFGFSYPDYAGGGGGGGGGGPPASGCRISASSLTLDESTIEQGETTHARIQVHNDGSRSQTVRVTFRVDGHTVSDSTRTITGSSEFSAGVSPDDDATITALVRTEGDSCGDRNIASRSRELQVGPEDDGDAHLAVEVEDEDDDPLEAEVELDGPEDRNVDTGSDGEYSFSLEPGDYDVTVSADGYRTEQRSIDLESGESRTLRFSLRPSDEEAELEVTVRDEDGRRLENARVRAENGESRTRFTDDDGEATFDLEPGSYDVTATKNGYRPDSDDVFLSDGEREQIELELEERSDIPENLAFDGIGYSNTVCRGSAYRISPTVRNTGDGRTVSLSASGLGGSDSTNFYLGSGERTTRTLELRNVRGSSQESFTVRLSSEGDSKTATRTVQLRDCTGGGGGPGDGSDRTVSVRVEPQQINLGETVRVSGYVDGVRGRSEVDIELGGRKVADVTTEPDGYYQVYVQPQRTGSLNVEASSGSSTATGNVNVLPYVHVTSVSAPGTAFEDTEFEICGNVETPGEARVVLEEDGSPVQTEYGSGEVCFDVQASPGEHTYTVAANAGGNTDSGTAEVRVQEVGPEATSFPDRITTVRSGEGIVRVSLYNTADEQKRYTVSMSEFPEDWFASSQQQLVLSSGERGTVYFYVTPEAEGEFEARLDVETVEGTIYSDDLNVRSGGTTEEKRWWERLTARLRLR